MKMGSGHYREILLVLLGLYLWQMVTRQLRLVIKAQAKENRLDRPSLAQAMRAQMDQFRECPDLCRAWESRPKTPQGKPVYIAKSISV